MFSKERNYVTRVPSLGLLNNAWIIRGNLFFLQILTSLPITAAAEMSGSLAGKERGLGSTLTVVLITQPAVAMTTRT